MNEIQDIKMLNQNQAVWNSVDDFIEPLLKCVLQTPRVGVSCGKVEASNVTSSCGKEKGDRFHLSIPYAGKRLVWSVFFNSLCPELGPDFLFNDDTFLDDPDLDTIIRHVPSLAHWDVTSDDALLMVIIELLMYYKQHQIELLGKQGERLQFEYSTLVSATEICAEDLEVVLLPSGLRPIEARFLIRMAMDFSKLPERSTHQDDEAMLLVTFNGPDWNRITPELYLSKSLEEAFGGQAALHIPPFISTKCLMDYVPEVKRVINEKIILLATCFEKRKSFIAALLLLKRGSIIEYDAVESSQATLLFEYRDFYCMVHFKLPPAFPKEAPLIVLQSIYHMTSMGTLFCQTVEDLPFSHRWTPFEMVTKALNHIVEKEVQKFQTNSVKSSHF
ncbi:BRISC and BRCA1-A complex member 2-like isoform X2 [Athalia rosae]|uniref:BRISC and BRCA1-A complex member 2-like isoform X2 n=1 Tax=Athalia rosae TaxID=37344 RepID=UPI0006254E0D|nr:BRISC and BRCA1-A complex member 2-like isoform X2 [Athalia rosae]